MQKCMKYEDISMSKCQNLMIKLEFDIIIRERYNKELSNFLGYGNECMQHFHVKLKLYILYANLTKFFSSNFSVYVTYMYVRASIPLNGTTTFNLTLW